VVPGVVGVIVLYLAVSAVCLRVLGPEGLAATTTPASQVMRHALGEAGARAIALGIAISTLGFLSQSMLTAPRVYYAMATDGLFFRAVARVHPRTRVPMAAIALQGLLAVVIALGPLRADPELPVRWTHRLRAHGTGAFVPGGAASARRLPHARSPGTTPSSWRRSWS
jgi:amino acid transporter